MKIVTQVVTQILAPVTKLLERREQRRLAENEAKAKLLQAKQSGDFNVELSDQAWEHLAKTLEAQSWKDEYVTVSVVSVFNLFVLGGIFGAFGRTELLEGIALSVSALVQAGVDVGFIMQAVVLAAIGLSIWRSR